MSYPLHPKAAQITKMLMEMRPCKEIAITLNVPLAAVRWQISRKQMLRIPLTREERLLIAAKRGIDPKLVP